MSHFLYQIADPEDISISELAEFCVLSKIHVSKTRFKQINTKPPCIVYSKWSCAFHRYASVIGVSSCKLITGKCATDDSCNILQVIIRGGGGGYFR